MSRVVKHLSSFGLVFSVLLGVCSAQDAQTTPQQALQQIQQTVQTLEQQLSLLGPSLDAINQATQDGLAYVPPTPPTPPLDVLTWWNPKPGKAVRPTFVRVLPDGRVASYYIKTKSGWPFDIKIADADGIKDVVTENDQTDASGNKIGWPGHGFSTAYRYHPVASKIAPRYYDPSQGQILVADLPDLVSYVYSTDCTNFTTTHLGPTQAWFSYERGVDFGGDLGTQDSLVVTRYYSVLKRDTSGKPLSWRDRERYFLTADSGWVEWERASSTDGVNWNVSQANILNKFIPDQQQVPVQPCNIAF